MIGTGFIPNFLAFRAPTQNADAQRTQGAMAGGASAYDAQTRDKKEKARKKSLTAVGNSARTKTNINDALQKPARKKNA